LVLKKEELKMIQEKPIRIIGSGVYLPSEISSDEIEKKYNLPQGFSERHSGVQSRHHVTFEDNGYMGARAVENALSNAQLKLEDIDLLIAASATFDYPIPNKASVILSQLNVKSNNNIGTIDIDTTCLSFVSAFDLASKFLDGILYKRVIIVCSEIASKGLNPSKPECLTLFGDGAAAFIIGYDEQADSRFYAGKLQTFTEGVEYTIIRGGGNKFPIKDYPYQPDLHSFEMDGLKLLRLAKQKLPEFIASFLDKLNVSIEKIDKIIPHQASKAGLTILKNAYSFKENQVMENISTHGNCIAASIPLLLHQSINSGAIKRNDNCLLIGTSAGFSIGAVLFKF
jgi:3-oxoacyl-[acyl-carrier-protein] synthase III